jgi:alanyl-tRNA synthetase
MEKQHLYEELKSLLGTDDIMRSIEKLMQDNDKAKKEIEQFEKEKINQFTNEIKNKVTEINGIHVIREIKDMNPDGMKQAAYNLRTSMEKLAIVFGTTYGEKPNLIVALSDDLVAAGFNAGQLVREAGKLIQGGGGGQPSLATAGGKNPAGIEAAVDFVISKLVN